MEKVNLDRVKLYTIDVTAHELVTLQETLADQIGSDEAYLEHEEDPEILTDLNLDIKHNRELYKKLELTWQN